MKNCNLLITFFILTIFTLKQYSCEVSVSECPSFIQTADFSDHDELFNVQHKAVKKLWRSSEPPLTKLGMEFKNMMFDLAKSKVEFWRATAYATSEWIWGYLPKLNKNPNFCSYSQMVNATVAFIDRKDCQFMFTAIDDVLTELVGTISMYRSIGIDNSGCRGHGFEIKTHKIPVLPGCYDDGFTYDFYGMWEKVGWEYPCKYRQIVEKMYKSEEKIDKIMALMATSILSEQMGFIEADFSPELEFQLLARATTKKIPESCCERFLNNFDILFKQMQKETDRVRGSTKNATSCTYP